jgi:hypothetical protein
LLRADIGEKQASMNRSELADTLHQDEALGVADGCVANPELEQCCEHHVLGAWADEELSADR